MTAFVSGLNKLSEEGKLFYEKDKLLSTCSTFRIGGAVDYAVFPKSEEGFAEAYALARDCGLDARVVGNASNILFPDEGVRGVILFTTAMKSVRFAGEGVTACAGESLTGLSVKAQKRGLAGLEFGYGIPGSVGGAVYMNAGAYEHATSDVLKSSRAYDCESGKIVRLEGADHAFAYRHSVYMDRKLIVLSASFSLKEDDPAAVKARMDDYMDRRKSKQPLELPSAGSVFKRYPGHYTGKLIEDAGLKGKTVGGAQVSTKHAGFIVNVGNATAKDVKELVSFIEETVYRIHGFKIERELIYF